MIYTTIGHWTGSPEEPQVAIVEAEDIAGAIAAGEADAREWLGDPDGVFVNDFVIEGEAKIVSTWAG